MCPVFIAQRGSGWYCTQAEVEFDEVTLIWRGQQYNVRVEAEKVKVMCFLQECLRGQGGEDDGFVVRTGCLH